MPKEKISELRKMLDEFSKLSDVGKDKTNDYAEGVKDALSVLRLVSRLEDE